jgi:hypothetical protein
LARGDELALELYRPHLLDLVPISCWASIYPRILPQRTFQKLKIVLSQPEEKEKKEYMQHTSAKNVYCRMPKNDFFCHQACGFSVI